MAPPRCSKVSGQKTLVAIVQMHFSRLWAAMQHKEAVPTFRKLLKLLVVWQLSCRAFVRIPQQMNIKMLPMHAALLQQRQ